MNKKMKLYKSLFVLLLGSTVVASDGTQILYSINMPGNPFQQPYYQMMIKADNENSAYTFSAANPPGLVTFNACIMEDGCGSKLNPGTIVTSDYVSLYADSVNQFSSPHANSFNGNSFLGITYGLSPYVFRGYTEGIASTLYMQRPAQVQLPFNPLAQNGGTAPVNATLPDYSDVFLAQTEANLYTSLACSSGNCTFNSTSSKTVPSWLTYSPRKNGPDSWFMAGQSLIFYGTMSFLSQPQSSSLTVFSPYQEYNSHGAYIPLGVSITKAAYELPVIARYFWYPILSYGVFDVLNSWLPINYVANETFNANYMTFAPIVSPGYSNSLIPNSLVQTVLPTGDLSGNFSVANTNTTYIPSGNPVATHDGVTLNNGMSYFQLFAQNMQWFNQIDVSLSMQVQYALSGFSIENSSSSYSVKVRNITPGQGMFSDAIQIAAMQAPAAIAPGATRLAPVFTGSVPAITEGITGPVVMSGAAPVPGGSPVNFTVPQAFLSKLTVDNFRAGNYLQVPLANQTTGTWSGGLVQSVSEDPLQYYQGVTPLSSLYPYLPIYFSDPGRPLDQPGWNYSPVDTKNGSRPMYYNTGESPMTNFYTALNGTR
jgi:hypothetical protein